MVRYGIIGTSLVTGNFIEASKHVKNFRLNAIYSRKEEMARKFADKYNVKNIFTDIEEMAKSDTIDAIYIASPNSLHAEQSKIFLKNKKSVICEKPMASNVKELEEVISTAKENNVLLMEAMISSFLPCSIAIRENLHKIGNVRRYIGNYCQYSSKYDAFKSGALPNIFNPKFSAGSLMDIGIYCVYPLIQLFGEPNVLKANGHMLSSGVDGEGSIIMKYDDMEAVVIHSKITNSHIGSEIQGEDGSILIDMISNPKKVEIVYNNGEKEDISVEQLKPNMYYEIEEFVGLIGEGKTESTINSYEKSLQVMGILEKAREGMEVRFPSDN